MKGLHFTHVFKGCPFHAFLLTVVTPLLNGHEKTMLHSVVRWQQQLKEPPSIDNTNLVDVRFPRPNK